MRSSLDRIATPWVAPLAAALLAATIASASLLAARRPAPAPTATRTAIRVDCARPAACELASTLAVDTWSEARGRGLPLDVVVTEDGLARLAAAGVAWQVLVPDIDAVARAEARRLSLQVRSADRPADWFAEYRDYRAISEHLRELAELAPDRATLHGIGASLDGRTIWALRIGNGDTPMLVHGTLHAREWISAMATTCLADRLVRERDPELEQLVASTELWVVPVVNPDGYQYSWSTNRYWRKNRRDRHGVDLNRNFGVAWGGEGSSGNKRSEIYRGAYAFSEPETAALRDLSKREQFALHIDFHAYGQLVMYPWNYTASPSRDRDRFAAIGDRMASAMYAQHGTRYRLINGVELYPSAGTSSDWYYGELGALSYGIELRPNGRPGFVLPPEQIRPTCDEALAAVLALRASVD